MCERTLEQQLAKMQTDLKRANRRDKLQLLQRLMVEKYDDLMLHEETDTEKLANGRFVITNRVFAHTAFHTETGLFKWLQKTGITKGSKIEHLHNCWKLIGGYTVISMSGNAEKLEAFAKQRKLRPSEMLDNGELTRAFIREGKTRNTIYYLNCNYPREVLSIFLKNGKIEVDRYGKTDSS